MMALDLRSGRAALPASRAAMDAETIGELYR